VVLCTEQKCRQEVSQVDWTQAEPEREARIRRMMCHHLAVLLTERTNAIGEESLGHQQPSKGGCVYFWSLPR
jgi:hypothetical protein